MNELLVTNSSKHMRNTRYCDLNFLCPRYNYAMEGGRSFTVHSIQDWNSIPRCQTVLENYSSFQKSLLKKFLVTQKKTLVLSVEAVGRSG